MIYQWKGYNATKERVSGEIEAPSLLIARTLLMQQGIKLKKIKKKVSFFLRNQKITSQSITVFTRQIASLLNSGFSLTQAIEIFKSAYHKNQFSFLLKSIQKDLESGLNFSQSLAKYPNFFNGLYCSLVQVAEKTASLATILDKIATYRENNDALKAQIKKSCSYPLIVLSVALLISNILLIVVIPQFKLLFESFGAQLPFLTQSILSLSESLERHWGRNILVIMSLSLGIYYLKKTSMQFSEKFDRLLLKIPLLGSLFIKGIYVRFSSTLALTALSGLPLVEALDLTSKTAVNGVYVKAIGHLKEAVLGGASLSTALEKTGLFSARIIYMLRIGEEMGASSSMLNKIAEIYEKEIKDKVNQLNLFLEPFIMIVLGLLIGILLLALYIPIFKLGTVI